MDNSLGIIITDAACPLCGSADPKPLLEGLEDVEDRVPGHYTMGRCSKCGVVYLSTRPTEESLHKCYTPQYHVHDPVRRKPIPKFLYGLRWKSRCRHLLGNLDENCHALLEVGCGDAIFLELLDRKMPVDCTLTGIDLMVPTSLKGTSSRLNLIQGEFEKVDFPVKYDAVVMFGVLEHLANPFTSLKKVSQHLKSGGVLFGSIPNWDCVWRRLFPRHWAGLQVPRHQTLFEPASLRSTLKAAGYDLVNIRYTSDPGDLAVTLCNWIADKLKLRTPPRRVWFYFPAILLSAPVVWTVDVLSRNSGTMEFTARRR